MQIVDSGSRAEGFNFINNKPSSSFSPAKGNSSDSIAFAPPQKVKITPPKVVKKSGVSVIVAKKVGYEQKIGPQNEQFDDSAKNLIRPQKPKSPSPPRNLVEVVSISPSKKAGVGNHEREESPPSIISNLQNSDKLEKSKKSISIKQPSSMQNRNTTGKPDFSSREDKSTMQDTQTTQKPILNNLALSDSQSVENGIQDRNNPGTKSRDDKSKWILGSVIDEEESDFEDNHSPKYKESSHSELRNPSRYMSAIKIEKEELTKAERFKMIRSKGKTAFEIGTKPLESLQNGRKHPRHHSNTQREMGDAT